MSSGDVKNPHLHIFTARGKAQVISAGGRERTSVEVSN